MANHFTAPYESGGASLDIDGDVLFAGTNFCNFTANAAVGPRGNVDATHMTAGADTPDRAYWEVFQGRLINAGTGGTDTSPSTAYYFSIFVKAAEHSWCMFYLSQDDTNSNNGVYFNLGTGAWGSDHSGGLGTVNVDYGAEAYPNGWYRLWMKKTSQADNDLDLGVRLATADNDATLLNESGNGIYVWGGWLDTVDYTDWNDRYTPEPGVHVFKYFPGASF